MSDEKPKLKPLKGIRANTESDKAVQACNDWLRLGPGRSLPELLARYSKIQKNIAPTLSQATLAAWSSKYDWPERAEAYDNDTEGKKNAQWQEVMTEGLALDSERVVKLKRLANFLECQIYEDAPEYPNVWLRDVKMIGSGVAAEAVELRRFNAPLIGEYRATLDDLAKETGGRKSKMEVTGKDGGPIKNESVGNPDERTLRRLAELFEQGRARRNGGDDS